MVLNKTTGVLGGYDYGCIHPIKEVATRLWSSDGVSWNFPSPKPCYNSNDIYNEHVRLVVDGSPVDSGMTSWTWGYEDGREVLESVIIGGSLPSSEVLATYSAVLP